MMLFCFCLLLAGGVSVVSRVTPAIYVSTGIDCGQHDILQENQLVHADSRAGPGDSLLLPIISLRLLPDNCSQWLTSTGLL